MIRRIALLAFALFLITPTVAHAQGYNGDTGELSIQAGGDGFQPGGQITVRGSGFEPFSEVIVEINPIIGTLIADGDGAINGSLALPDDLADGPHVITASGVASDGSTLVLNNEIVVGGDSGSGTDDADDGDSNNPNDGDSASSDDGDGEGDSSDDGNNDDASSDDGDDEAPAGDDDGGGSSTGVIIIVILAVLVLGGAVGYFLWQRQRSSARTYS